MLRRVNLGIWHVYQLKNAGEKTTRAVCYVSYMSETIRLTASNGIMAKKYVINQPLPWSLCTWSWTAPQHHSTHPRYRYEICKLPPLYSCKSWIDLDKLASSMKRIRQPRCSVVGCTDQHKCLHVTPASEDTREKWIYFIFEGNVPARIGKYLLVCANHFESDYFTNLGQYDAGLSTRLALKGGSVPSIRRNTADEKNKKM